MLTKDDYFMASDLSCCSVGKMCRIAELYANWPVQMEYKRTGQSTWLNVTHEGAAP
jgi:hypothetical protein